MNLVPNRAISRQVLRLAVRRQAQQLSYHRPRSRPLLSCNSTQWLIAANRSSRGRRTFFPGILSSTTQQRSLPDILEYLSDASRKLQLRIRPPPQGELVQNLADFFSRIRIERTTLTDFQLGILKPVVDYVLCKSEGKHGDKLLVQLPQWLVDLGIDPRAARQAISQPLEEPVKLSGDANLSAIAVPIVAYLKDASADVGKTNVDALLEESISKGHSQAQKTQRYNEVSADILEGSSLQLKQMRSLIREGDIDSAAAIWESLDFEVLEILSKEHDVPIFDTTPREAVGELIKAITTSVDEGHEELLKGLVTWHETHIGRLDSETLSSVVCYFLSIEDYSQAISLTHSNAPYLFSSERLSVISNLEKFAFERLESSDVETPWHICNLFTKLFIDVPRSTLQRFMIVFIELGEVEYGMHIFLFLRNSHRAERRPDERSYIELLQTLSKSRPGDFETLQKVHGQLKIDTFVDPSTGLWNTLLGSYLQAGVFDRALVLWDEFDSIGLEPTVDTYKLVLLVQGMSNDARPADIDELWKRIESEGMDEEHPSLLSTYIGALVCSERTETAMKIIKELEAPEALPSLYYASMEAPEIQQWIETEFPDEMGNVLGDRACKELYRQLTRARFRAQGIDLDEADELLEGEEITAATLR